MREVPNVEFNIRKMVTLTIVSAVKKKKKERSHNTVYIHVVSGADHVQK